MARGQTVSVAWGKGLIDIRGEMWGNRGEKCRYIWMFCKYQRRFKPGIARPQISDASSTKLVVWNAPSVC